MHKRQGRFQERDDAEAAGRAGGPGGHGRKPRHEHRKQGLLGRRVQPDRREDPGVHSGPRGRQAVRRRLQRQGTLRLPGAASQDHPHGQGRRAGRRHDRPDPATPGERRPPHRRRQLVLHRHRAPRRRPGQGRSALHRHRRQRRRRGRAERPLHHARRPAGSLQTHRGRPAENLGPGRRPLLHLHRASRRGPLRQDGPQRHRVRRHAVHRRDLRRPAVGAAA